MRRPLSVSRGTSWPAPLRLVRLVGGIWWRRACRWGGKRSRAAPELFRLRRCGCASCRYRRGCPPLLHGWRSRNGPLRLVGAARCVGSAIVGPGVVGPARYPHHGRERLATAVLSDRASSADGREDAPTNCDKDESTHHTAHGNSDVAVLLEKLTRLFDKGRALADAVLAVAAAGTRRTVEEVLVQDRALVGRRPRGRASNDARCLVASLDVGDVGERSHHGLALQVARGALARRTREARIVIAARSSVVEVRVAGARRRGTRALFLGIAQSRASAANGARRGERAGIGAALFISGIANRVRRVFARLGIAARVSGTSLLATTVAVFARLNDTVAALLARNNGNVLVLHEASVGLPVDGGAHISDAAGGERLDTAAGRGVHDELATGITAVGAQGAASLNPSIARIACLVGAVVNGAKGVPDFVRDDLPLGWGADDDVGRRNRLVRRRIAPFVGARPLLADLAEPRETYGAIRGTRGEQSPESVGILGAASPLRKLAKTVRDCETVAAGHVPGRGVAGSGGAICLENGDILETEGNVKGALVHSRRRVDLLDDVLAQLLVRVKLLSVVAVRGNAKEGNLSRLGAPGSRSNVGDKVDASTAAAGSTISLAAKKGGGRHLAKITGGARLEAVVGVEHEVISSAGGKAKQLALPKLFTMRLPVFHHVRVAPEDHVLVAGLEARLSGWAREGVFGVLQLDVVGNGLDMVVIAMQAESALEYGVFAIAAKGDSRPAAIHPFRSIRGFCVGTATVDAVICTRN